MKKITLFLSFFILSNLLFSQNVIFLHHSTGGGVWWGGNGTSVPAWISNYNTAHGTSIVVKERSYPDSPYPWENYPYDYWNLWLNGACNSANPKIECLNTLVESYDLVIFKHCYPGAAIQPDVGNPDVTSSKKTLENYKEQYRALRGLMDSYPTKKFMVWTLAPLHRLSTNTAAATRAKQFVDWVNNDWLTEDSKSHPNIYIFDFFQYAAEQNQSPANGQTYCLKYDYEISHSNGDSHPNDLANSIIAPLFGLAIVDALADTISAVSNELVENKINIFYSNGYIHIISNGAIDELNVEVYNMIGQKLISQRFDNQSQILVPHSNYKGVYLVKIQSNSFYLSKKILIE